MKNIVKYIKTLHERIKIIDISDLQGPIEGNPYSLCFHWLIEVIQYGTLATILVNFIIGWQGWNNFAFIFGIGIGRWLWLDIVEETSKAIKRKT